MKPHGEWLEGTRHDVKGLLQINQCIQLWYDNVNCLLSIYVSSRIDNLIMSSRALNLVKGFQVHALFP